MPEGQRIKMINMTRLIRKNQNFSGRTKQKICQFDGFAQS